MEMNFDQMLNGNIQLAEIILGGKTYHVKPEAKKLYEEILDMPDDENRASLDIIKKEDWYLYTVPENAILLLYAIDNETLATEMLKKDYMSLDIDYLFASQLFLPPLKDYEFFEKLYLSHKIDGDMYAQLQMLSGELRDTTFFDMWLVEKAPEGTIWLDKIVAYAIDTNSQSVIMPVCATDYLWNKCNAISGDDKSDVIAIYRAVLMGVIQCTTEQIGELIEDTRVDKTDEEYKLFKALVCNLYIKTKEVGDDNDKLIEAVEKFISLDISLQHVIFTPAQFFVIVKWNKNTNKILNRTLVKAIANNQQLIFYVEVLMKYVDLTDFQKELSIGHIKFMQYYNSLGIDLSDFIHCDYMFDENHVAVFNKITSEIWVKTPVDGKSAISIEEYLAIPDVVSAMKLEGKIDVLCEGTVDAFNIFNFVSSINTVIAQLNVE